MASTEIRATSTTADAGEVKAQFDQLKAKLTDDKDVKGSGKGGAITDFDVIRYLLEQYEKQQRSGIVRKDNPDEELRELVREMLQNNDKAEHDYQKRRITNAMLNKARKVKTGKAANNDAVNRIIGIFEHGKLVKPGEFSAEIEANHARNNIGEHHNRTAPAKHERAEPDSWYGY